MYDLYCVRESVRRPKETQYVAHLWDTFSQFEIIVLVSSWLSHLQTNFYVPLQLYRLACMIEVGVGGDYRTTAVMTDVK